MSTDIRVIRARDFIKANPEGDLDFDGSMKLLVEIESAATTLARHETLLDTRKATVKMSIANLWQLAAELANARKAFSGKTAVLCPLHEFDNAEFFALCAQNRGRRVSAFTSFEDAIDWLIADAT